jgi:hypothetical protein
MPSFGCAPASVQINAHSNRPCSCNTTPQIWVGGCSESIHWNGALKVLPAAAQVVPSCVLPQGMVLEPAIGSGRFASLVAELLLVCQALLSLAAAGQAAAAPALCTAAPVPSGVLFALKVHRQAPNPVATCTEVGNGCGADEQLRCVAAHPRTHVSPTYEAYH